MSPRNKKVPAEFTAQTGDPGAKPADTTGISGVVTQAQAVADGIAFRNWVIADMARKASAPVPDYSSGSGSGINNGS